MKPSQIPRITVNENDVLESIEIIKDRALGENGLLRKHNPGIFMHPHEIVGCMMGQVKKLSESADEVIYTDTLDDFEIRCIKTLYASLFALVSVRKLKKSNTSDVKLDRD